MPKSRHNGTPAESRVHCHAVVIWIDWYAYHFARFAGLQEAFGHNGEVSGIELVGGVGVHEGLHFRAGIPDGLPVDTLFPQKSWKQASKLKLAIRLWKRLSTLNPELVLVPGYYTLPAIAAALWARFHRRASILMTESTADDHARNVSKEKLKSTIIRLLFDWAVTGGIAHVRYLLQLGFRKDRIVSFYDVVDNSSLEKRTKGLRLRSASSYNLPDSYFLYVGRMAPEKNISGLLKAWMEYRIQGGTWPLLLVGDGPEMAALKATAAHSVFAESIHFAGHKTSEELPLYYAFAGCFVLPSTREPWGLVVNEAMACSLPVIVSNRCGCAEDLVREGENGFIFDPYSIPALTRCLHTIAQLDAEQHERMARMSSTLIRDYSPQNFGAELALIGQSTRMLPKPETLDRRSRQQSTRPSTSESQ